MHSEEESARIYFEEVQRHKVLTPKQEAEASASIVALECSLWASALNTESTLPELLEWLEPRIAALPEDKPVVAAFRNLKQVKRKRQKRTWQTCCRAFALAARMSDMDRVWLRKALALTIDESSEADVMRANEKRLKREKDRFLKRNLRLVLALARKHKRGASLLDVVQEGNLGLIRALDRFDPELGFRFSTYACWWILHQINRSHADHGRTVRVPVHLVDSSLAVVNARVDFSMKHGREPTSEDLQQITGLDPAKIEKSIAVFLGPTRSLDVEDGDGLFLDMVASTPASQDSSLENDEAAEVLSSVLSTLDGREADIIRRRFGIGCSAVTLREIGDSHNVSRERVRQIQEATFEKLRLRLLALGLSQNDVI